MTIDDIKILLHKGEDIQTEYKEAVDSVPSSFYETVASFSNTDGGTILLGVTDDGLVSGINPASEIKIKKDIITALNSPDCINPPVSIEPFSINHPEGLVMVVQIPVSSQVHQYHDRIYRRSFESDLDITDDQVQVSDMFLRKRNFFTEAQIIPHLSFTDLDASLFEKARTIIRNVRGDHPWLLVNEEQMLREASLWRKDFYSNQQGLTMAAALLFGTEATIQSLLPAYKVEVMVRVENTDRWDDRLTLRKNLIDTYLEIKQFIYKYLPEKFYTEKDQRIDLRDKIFREVIGNAIIHREYTSAYSTDIIISDSEVRITNPNKPLFHGLIDPLSFNPYAKNPNIRKFFTALGWADEIGSGIRNTNKYLPLYITGAKPVFSENDTFLTIIPLQFVTLLSYAGQFQQWLGLPSDALPHLKKGLTNIALPTSLNEASWQTVLLQLVPGWHEKGTKLPVLDWPVNHPFTKTFTSKPVVTQHKGTNLANAVSSAYDTNGTNPPINTAADIQSLINEGEKKVPTWHEISTNFLHKKVVYLLSILALCSEPISLNALMHFMVYANRKAFRDNYLTPLRQAGFINMSEIKTDPEQKYFLSESGKAFLGGLKQ